jgi:hypothetical protein
MCIVKMLVNFLIRMALLLAYVSGSYLALSLTD